MKWNLLGVVSSAVVGVSPWLPFYRALGSDIALIESKHDLAGWGISFAAGVALLLFLLATKRTMSYTFLMSMAIIISSYFIYGKIEDHLIARTGIGVYTLAAGAITMLIASVASFFTSKRRR